MKILLVAHGYPPESNGGIERSVQSQARALAAARHTVVVAVGTIASDGGEARSLDVDPRSAARVRVVRLSRADLCPDHWQKSASSTIPARFRELLRAETPDVVHVHHWRRLSRDLVANAALEGVPAVVTLHDSWSTCLIATRLRSDTGAACDAPLAPTPCLGCAGRVAPFTPWVPLDQQFMALASHRSDLVRELQLARALIVPSRTHGEMLARVLGDDARAVEFTPLAALAALPAQRELELAELVAIYERAVQAGAPSAPSDVDAWYGPRMRAFAEEHWDRSAVEAARADLGSKPT